MLGQEAGQDVGLLVVSDADQDIGLQDALRGQQVEIAAVALDDQGALHRVGEGKGTLGVGVDEFDGQVLFLVQQGGGGAADQPAAEDHDLFQFLLRFAHQGDDGGDVAGGGHDENLVAVEQDVVASGDDGLRAAKDGDHAKDLSGRLLADLVQLLVQQGTGGVDADADQLHPVLGEFQHVGGSAALDQLHDLLGRLLLGMDGQIDTPVRERKMGGLMEELRDADAGDLLHDAEVGGHAAGHDVGLVVAGNGDQHVGLLDAGFPEQGGRGAMTEEGFDVQVLVRRVDALRLAVDGNDVVAFPRQDLGQVRTDLAEANENDVLAHSG